MADKEENFVDTKKDKKFLKAIKLLKNDYDQNNTQSSLANDFFPVWSSSSISRYLHWANPRDIYFDDASVPERKKEGTYRIVGGFPSKTRNIISWIANPLDWAATYSIIGRVIGLKREPFPKKLEGQFKYYRFFPKDGGDLDTDHDYVSGQIKIENKGDNIVRVKHWSHDFDNGQFNSRKPEHQGYAYYSGNRLIMILFRDGVVRLVTANCHGQDINEPVNAVVQTVLKRSFNPIFAAQVALIKDIKENKQLNDEFDPRIDQEGNRFLKHIQQHGSAAKGVLLVR